jgi:hypothetical protein
MAFEKTGDFKLPGFDRTSPNGFRVRWDSINSDKCQFWYSLSYRIYIDVAELPWLIETLQELAAQTVTRDATAITTVASTGGVVTVTVTLGELAKGIPITIGKKP